MYGPWRYASRDGPDMQVGMAHGDMQVGMAQRRLSMQGWPRGDSLCRDGPDM